MSYLSYYNMFSDFNAGAGVTDTELFTKEEEEAFLPKHDNITGEYNFGFPFKGSSFPNILMRNDIRALIGLILFVLAITTTPVIAVIMIAVASALLPFPSLVIAYCLSVQIINPGNNNATTMSIICVALAIIAIFINSISKTAYIITYIILAVLFCIYAFNLTRSSKNNMNVTRCPRDIRGGDKHSIEKPSFYED
ncbi:SPV106 putative phosphorylated IMV membrane protein [Swinepox virus]|uniref:SPV106 putative phosphorylated IMV membrane protein n=1 Tax=Swinepox virus (strain Swine/Nebraska/17077-99/1999) TaxID=300880 RepID=Q8V3J0_SWPV1|nr:SPV106 putative phosphorylated IMV membrane protein [Swinepox virus]AAL69845.1 SPV106 putative phosphorylated IMV membrane protein [Swinepox virus]UED36623.1 SPV106 putative phosphorylated IMV membrane protein [Swinepox virus]UED36772.1 SPV106 putative phosphorylated IMV membrane protein [Swinepox virus]UUA44296.1 SPV106 [Swinepox virus]